MPSRSIRSRTLKTASELLALLRQNKRFVLTTHKRPDGDGFGSELALHRFLKRLHKRSDIINVSEAPSNLNFLLERDKVRVYRPERDDPVIRKADMVVALDIGGLNKIGTMKDVVLQSSARTLLIDHHLRRDRSFDYYWVDEKASSSGEMVYRLLQSAGPRTLRRDMAVPLYTAIVHDTGDFCYDRTDAGTFRMAAHLVEAGAVPYKIFMEKQCARTPGQVALIAYVLGKAQVTGGGILAWSQMPHTALRRFKVDNDNLPRVVDQILRIRNVEMALMFVALNPRTIKVSVRSKSYADSCAFARRYGGGGHQKSAGFGLALSMKEAQARVLRDAKRFLKPGKR